MKLYRNLLLALLASISLNASSESSSESGGCCPNEGDSASTDESARRCNPRGSYAYNLDGTFGIRGDSFREIGVITFDGFGDITARGTTVIAGSLVQQPAYTCTYSFINDLGHATCSRTDTLTGTVISPLTFALAHGECCDIIMINVLPAPNTPFAITSISGFARK